MADEYRELCPDGACIGLIGADGRCKECGQVGESAVSDPRHRGQRRESDGAADASDDGFVDRELCPDGACVGVIGDDGRCGECGRSESTDEAAGGELSVPSSDVPADGGADDWDDRQLCPDGACVGVLNSAGRCPECGRSAGS